MENHLQNQIIAEFQAQNFAEVLRLAESALLNNPPPSQMQAFLNNAVAVSNLYLNTPKRAIPYALKAAALEPSNAMILSNTGFVLAKAAQSADDFQKSLDFLERAIAQKPDYAAAFENLSYTYFQLGNYSAAMDFAKRAIALNPKSALAHFNYATAAYKAALDLQAFCAGKKAIELEPHNAYFYNDVSVFARSVGNTDEAIWLANKAIEFAPNNLEYNISPLLISNYIPTSCAVLRKEAERLHQVFKRLYPKVFEYKTPQKRKPSKIGFVSADFGAHVISFYVESLFQHLKNVEIFAFSNSFFEDAKTQDFKKFCTEFHIIAGLDDWQAAAFIHNKGIDVLVDLSGLTMGHRLGVFAQRPAPVQLTWIGWMNTTGCPNMHWILCDETLCPKGAENQFFPEKPCRMPKTWAAYFPPKNAPNVVPPPVLTNGFITFGAFQNPNKAGKWTFDLWAGVLHVNPSAHFLWVRPPFSDADFRRKIISEFTRRGVHAERITLLANRGMMDYLNHINKVDIVLDTTPATGGATSCESLYMGVPMITLAGERMGDRLSATYLKNVGLADCIAESEESYLAKSLYFSQNPQWLAEIRHNLRETMQKSALMDYAGFARDFQNALDFMWAAFLKNPSS